MSGVDCQKERCIYRQESPSQDHEQGDLPRTRCDKWGVVNRFAIPSRGAAADSCLLSVLADPEAIA
jgi:hypothetical protein